MDFLAFVFRFLAKGVGFFLLALVLWEIVALIVMSGSFGSFLKSLDSPLAVMALFFNGLYALPIVLYLAIAFAVSHLLRGWARTLAFVGLCCVGSLGLIGFFMKFATDLAQLRKGGFVAFIAYPTSCVIALYLGRSVFQQPTVKVGE